MKQRVLTAVLAGALFLTLVIIGDIYFTILVYVLATIGLHELLKMKKIKLRSLQGVLSLCFLWLLLSPYPFTFFTKTEGAILIVLALLALTVLTKNEFNFDDAGFILLSTFYIGFGFFYLIETRQAGLHYLFFALFVIWATDSGAYFIGRAFGKKKLWPIISPNKTIEGFIGGIFAALITALIFHIFIPIHYSMAVVLLVAVLISIFGQIGDLVESAFKRHYIVKDSGHLLPGHGGILDRFDSLLFILPLLHLVKFI